MNVLVVAAHGLHCHWLGPYGNEWVSTPAFDAIAAEAVVFDQHFAVDPSPAGFAAAFPCAAVRDLRAGGVFAAFLDDRKDRSPDSRDWNQVFRTDASSHPTPGDALLACIELAIDQLKPRAPWLLWVESDRLVPPWDFDIETYQHYAAATGRFADDIEDKVPAGPIDVPPDGRTAPEDDILWHRLHNSFAAAVTSFDAEVDILIEVLRERKLDESAAWMFTSGYGWPLGEHGVIGPAESRMHTELVHLPLIVRMPGQGRATRRVLGLTQSSALAPTLLDLFGIRSGAFPAAGSLLAVTTGPPSGTPAIARSASARSSHVERAVRTPEWCFLPAVPETGEPSRLYRKPDDVWEVNDLAPRHADECDRLTALADEKEPTP